MPADEEVMGESCSLETGVIMHVTYLRHRLRLDSRRKYQEACISVILPSRLPRKSSVTVRIPSQRYSETITSTNCGLQAAACFGRGNC